MLGRGIYYVFSCLVAIITLIFLLKFFGITWNDVHYFIEYGIGGALDIIKELRDSILSNPVPGH